MNLLAHPHQSKINAETYHRIERSGAEERKRMSIATTPVYAVLLTFLYVILSVRVIGLRRFLGVALGDGEHRDLLSRQRVHANFAEYVPIALILMTLAELQGLPDWALNAVGILLSLGRVLHAYGVSQETEQFRLRASGMALT